MIYQLLSDFEELKLSARGRKQPPQVEADSGDCPSTAAIVMSPPHLKESIRSGGESVYTRQHSPGDFHPRADLRETQGNNQSTVPRSSNPLCGPYFQLAHHRDRATFPTMPKTAVIFGILLDLLGTGAFVATGSTHFTALIPLVFGTPILLCGLLAMIKPDLRKHAMHVAAMFGLLGALGGLGMGLPKLGALMDGTAQRPVAVALQIAMGVIALVFLALCIKSFIDARRARTKTGGA